MENRILFVGAASSFIINAVRDGLKESGFSCVFCSLSIGELHKLQDRPHIIFIYVDEKATMHTESIVYLKDMAMESDSQIYLIGYSDELALVKEIIPVNILGGTYERPINVKKIAEDLKALTISNVQNNFKKHILLVDDSGTMLRTIKGWLDTKYRISMANSATSAISFLATNHPDLILLDYEMPICSGPMMLQMIRSEVKTESIPVIFLTSKGDKESVEKVLALKPQGYLLKSMPPDAIVEAVDNFFMTQKAKNL